jgi:hypothetical protein
MKNGCSLNILTDNRFFMSFSFFISPKNDYLCSANIKGDEEKNIVF